MIRPSQEPALRFLPSCCWRRRVRHARRVAVGSAALPPRNALHRSRSSEGPLSHVRSRCAIQHSAQPRHGRRAWPSQHTRCSALQPWPAKHPGGAPARACAGSPRRTRLLLQPRKQNRNPQIDLAARPPICAEPARVDRTGRGQRTADARPPCTPRGDVRADTQARRPACSGFARGGSAAVRRAGRRRAHAPRLGPRPNARAPRCPALHGPPPRLPPDRPTCAARRRASRRSPRVSCALPGARTRAGPAHASSTRVASRARRHSRRRPAHSPVRRLPARWPGPLRVRARRTQPSEHTADVRRGYLSIAAKRRGRRSGAQGTRRHPRTPASQQLATRCGLDAHTGRGHQYQLYETH
ncbi:hypothetical protein PsYK624_111210 [Phanerochaete sordida]|uniref:Uncharacterized protein n=1 Tax=Phanerochaete sordida TaxID=48140 RepID=A0A9P3LH38_9APHY|nr:hypothetical protein PsYK624_111210 [Phanerochaete sordida]